MSSLFFSQELNIKHEDFSMDSTPIKLRWLWFPSPCFSSSHSKQRYTLYAYIIIHRCNWVNASNKSIPNVTLDKICHGKGVPGNITVFT